MMEPEGEDSSVIEKQRLEESPRRTKETRNNSGQSNTTQQEPGLADKASLEVGICCRNAGLCCFKVKQRSQITALEYKLKSRQKKFGVDYLSLVERNASQLELKRCLRNAMEEIEHLQDEIDRHFVEMEGKEVQIKDVNASALEKKSKANRTKDDSKPKPANETKSKPKTKEAERPIFTIDSDEEDDYGPEQPSKTPRKKKAKKKGKKSPSA